MTETRTGQVSSVPPPAARPMPPVRTERFAGLVERQIGKAAGLTQFGVNHVTLAPGAWSSLRHWHEHEDEFVYVLSGEVVLVDDNGEHPLACGAFAGFPASEPNAHHLENRSAAPAVLLAVGLRHRGLETIHYPDDFASPRTVMRDARGERTAR